MRKDEYITEVTSGIKSEYVKLEIAAELGGHIDELTDFYLERGYTETEAEEKAVLEMGDGEKVGYDMSRLHKSLSVLFDIILTIFVFIICAFFARACPLNIGNSGYIYHYNLVAELVFLIACLCSSFYCKKHIKYGRLIVLTLFFLPIVIEYALSDSGEIDGFCSPTVFYLYYLANGRTESIKAILNLSITKIPFAFSVASAVFYLIIFAIIVANCICVGKIATNKYTYNAKKASSFISKITLSTALFVVLIFCCTYPLSFEYKNPYVDTAFVFGSKGHSILIAESDKPVSLSELTYNDMTMFTFEKGNIAIGVEPYFDNSPLFMRLEASRYDLKEFSYDKNISYQIHQYEFAYSPEKEYVYIYFADENELFSEVEGKYDPNLWLSADREYVFSSKDGEIQPNCYIKLTVKPNPAVSAAEN